MGLHAGYEPLDARLMVLFLEKKLLDLLVEDLFATDLQASEPSLRIGLLLERCRRVFRLGVTVGAVERTMSIILLSLSDD